MTETVTLEARLDTAGAEALCAKLTPFLGKSIAIDVSGVEHLGARCLEILLRLRHATETSGNSLALVNPSKALVADLATFGLTTDDISIGEPT